MTTKGIQPRYRSRTPRCKAAFPGGLVARLLQETRPTPQLRRPSSDAEGSPHSFRRRCNERACAACPTMRRHPIVSRTAQARRLRGGHTHCNAAKSSTVDAAIGRVSAQRVQMAAGAPGAGSSCGSRRPLMTPNDKEHIEDEITWPWSVPLREPDAPVSDYIHFPFICDCGPNGRRFLSPLPQRRQGCTAVGVPSLAERSSPLYRVQTRQASVFEFLGTLLEPAFLTPPMQPRATSHCGERERQQFARLTCDLALHRARACVTLAKSCTIASSSAGAGHTSLQGAEAKCHRSNSLPTDDALGRPRVVQMATRQRSLLGAVIPWALPQRGLVKCTYHSGRVL